MSITSVVNDNIGDSSFINAQKPIPPTISNYVVSGTDDAALLPAGGQTVLINGTGFQRGVTASISGTAIGVVTWVSANQLSFTSPASAAGTYTLYVVNSDGGTAIYVPGLIYSTNPTWTTAAGSLGSYYETQAISNTVVATDDTGSAMTYAVTSGSLPSGATLYANGLISGTAPVDSGSTTYSFTIDATDATLQSTSRSFSLTINTDVVTWVNPSNGATITLEGASYSNVLVATDAAGYSIASYTANALPAGLTLTGNTISGTPTVAGNTTTLLTATAATSNRSATNTITWVVNLGDVYWEYVTALLSATVDVLPFVDDASTNNFNITVAGDTRPNNFGPYTPGYYSNYFDGDGDWLLTASSPATLSADFTIEGWVYITSFAASRSLVCIGDDNTSTGAVFFVNTSGRLAIFGNGGNILVGTSQTVLINTWNHIAFVRSSGTIRAYLNGVVDSTTSSNSTAFTGINRIGGELFAGNAGGAQMLGYISNYRLVNGTAVYTANFTPSTIPLTAIANTSLLTCQSNRFIDNSTNNFTITVNGNTTINGFDPFVPSNSYATYGSGYFDGTGDYLTIPTNAAFQLGTDDFTIECWIYKSSAANGPIIDARGSAAAVPYAFYVDGSNFPYFYDGTIYTSTVAILNNQWNHTVVVRTSSVLKIFVNGVQGYSASHSVALNPSATVYIGGQNFATSAYTTGYISNLRIVKGTAVYTSAFTPPTAPLTAIANTSLLTLQTNQPNNNNMFVDNSTNNFLITRNGNTTQGTFSPYPGTWSAYFDGTGDTLTLPASQTPLQPGSGDFTIEFWYYTSLVPNTYYTLFSYGTTGDVLRLFLFTTNAFRVFTGATLIITSADNVHQVNTWQHVALVRSGTTLTLYVNGVSAGTSTSNSTNYVGNLTICYESINQVYYGYLSNFRIVKGTAVYTSAFTPSTTPLLPITNTTLLICNNNRFIDSSNYNYTITVAGDSNIQKFSPFGIQTQPTPTSYSVYFDGTGDYLTLPANAAFQFGTGDFTIEFWSNLSATGVDDGMFYEARSSGATSTGFALNSRGVAGGYRINFYTAGAANLTTNSVTYNTWNHIALTRSSGTVRIFLNGVIDLTATINNNFTENPGVTIGQSLLYANSNITGYLSNFRVVKGTAVYTANFTPPTAPLTAISNTSLLTCQSTTIIDNSTNAFVITVNGNSQPLQQNPFGYTNPAVAAYTTATLGGSMYFDGTGDYLTTPSNAAFTFGTGDLTLECWIYQTATSAATYRVIFADNVYGNTGGYTLYSYNNALTLWKGGSGGIQVIAPAGTITLNAWTHVAWTRAGSSNRLFINGTQVGATTTDATNYTSTISYIGASQTGTLPFAGYMSDARIIKGQARYTSPFVPPAAPVTAIQNSVLLLNGTSAGIYDSSMINDYETVGDVRLNTSVVKYGNSSIFFDGTGDYLTSRYVPSQEPGSSNLTWEMWIKTTSSLQYATLYSRQPGAFTSGMYGLLINSASATAGDVALWVADYNAGAPLLLTTGANVRDDNWHHIAVVRNGSAWVLYVDGTSRATGTWSGAIAALSTPPRIGADQNYGRAYTGYMDDVRITNGIARYTANFTSPSEPFQRN